MLYQNPKLKTLRQKLRNNSTEAERRLWRALRKSQIGYKFIRQYSVGRYILDFYCSSARLALELDGSQHMEKAKIRYDAERTKYLQQKNILVMRFYDNEVTTNLEGVIERIMQALNSIPS